MIETISDLARAALALQRGAAAEAAEILLDLLAEGGDPPLDRIRELLERAGAAGHEDSKLAATALIHSSRETLIQWAKGCPTPA